MSNMAHLHPTAWWHGRWVAAFVGVAGVLITLAVAWAMRHDEQQLLIAEFELRAAERSEAIERRLQTNLDLIEAMAGFYNSSEQVTWQEFQIFTDHLRGSHPGMQTIMWTPRVTREERRAYESTPLPESSQLLAWHRAQGSDPALLERLSVPQIEPYEIREHDAEGKTIRAAERDAYFPIQFISPWPERQRDWGLDMSMVPEVRTAMRESHRTGKVIATAPLKDRLVVLVGYVNRETEPQFPTHDGFVMATLDMHLLVQATTNADRRNRVAVLVRDLDAPAAQQVLFDNTASLNWPVLVTDTEQPAHPLHRQLWIEFAGRSWQLDMEPTQAFIGPWRTPVPYTVLGSGLVVTGSLVGLLLVVMGSAQRARQEAAERAERARQQGAVAELGMQALGEPSLQSLMDRACRVATRTLDVPYAKVLELLPDDAMRLRAGVGWKPGLVGHATVGTDRHSQAGYTLRSDEPVVVEDLARETRFTGSALLREHDMVSGMSVVIRGEHQPFGVMGIHTDRRRPFTRNDMLFLQAIANVLSHAIIQRRAEAKLRESEERFRTMADASPVLIWLADTRKDCTWFNRRWLEFTGRTMEQEQGVGWMQGMHPDDCEHYAQIFNQTFDRREPFRTSYRLRRSDGAYRWLLDEGAPRFTPDGTFIGYIGSCTDVSDQKHAEQQLKALNETLEQQVEHRTAELRETNKLLQREIGERQQVETQLRDTQTFLDSIVEHIPHMVFVKDAGELRFVLFNRAGEQLTGYSRDQLLGCNDHDFFPPQEASFFIEKDRAVLTQNRAIDIPEETLHTRDADVRILHTKKVPLLGVDGKPAYLLGISEDITERRRAEQRMRVMTAALQRSNRELEQFAYIASHDLQEPLRKVKGFGDMLLARAHEALDPESRDYLQRMQGAALRMQDLIDGLLTYSRVTTQAGHFNHVDLGAVVEGVVSDLEMRIRDTAGQVELGELPTAWADRLQMRQLFQNLIGNALKFHRPGRPPRVRVWGECVPADPPANQPAATPCAQPHRVRLHVQDEGIGFDEKYLDRIFVPFQRLHGRGKYEGTGMGLAVCAKIVERHGGTITAISTPDAGSVFTITLPGAPSDGHSETP